MAGLTRSAHANAVALTAAVVALLVLLVAGDVRIAELVLVALYQALFVVGPGLLLVRPLAPANAAIRWGAAWTVGTIAVTGLFLVGGAVGLHFVVWVLPVITVVFAIRERAFWWRPVLPFPPVSAGILLLCVAACGMLWVALYGPTPLLRDSVSASHYQDLVFHLAVAGEMLHHGWPFEDPSVAGEALRYQLLPHLDAAAGSYVTDIDLEVMLWRIQPVASLLAAALLAGGIARRIGASTFESLTAVTVLLFAAEADVTIAVRDFANSALVDGKLFSPTQLLAVPVLLTVLAFLVGRPAHSAPALALWALLGYGAMAAKVTVIFALLGGVAFAVLVATRRRAVLRDLVRPGGALLGGALVAYAMFYVGSRGNGLALDPLHALSTVENERAERAPFFWFVLCAPATGALAYVLIARPSRDDFPTWIPVGAFLASLGPYLLLGHPGYSEIYFLNTALSAIAPLSGVGIVLGFRWVLGWVGAAVAAVAVPAMHFAGVEASRGGSVIAAWLVAIAVLATGAVVSTFLTRGGRRLTRGLVFASVTLAALSLADPFLDNKGRARQVVRGETLASTDGGQGNGIRAPVFEGLVWVRDHSDTDDVLAVNNQYLMTGNPRYFYYAAVAERRVFLQGWAYSDRGASYLADKNIAAAFPRRVKLNAAAFAGRPPALRALSRRGVRFLFVDRRYGKDPAPTPQLRRVFQNELSAVYKIAP